MKSLKHFHDKKSQTSLNMNILFLCRLPILQNQGGIERVSFLLASEFSRKGHNVYAIYTTHAQKTADLASFPFCQIEFNSDDKRTPKLISDFIKSKNIDIVINQCIEKPHLKILKKIDRGAAKVITVLHNKPFPTHGIELKAKTLTYPSNFRGKLLKQMTLKYPGIYRFVRTAFDKSIYTEAVRFSDRLMLLSERFIDPLIKLAPNICRSKIDAINNPNTFHIPDSIKDKKENTIIWVGRLIDPQKNTKDFIDSWNIFQNDHPEWNSIIIGDGPHRRIFEEYANKTMARNLTFAGNQKDISKYYSKAKILCMTSLYEGWPMVLSEAMAYNVVPVVFNTFLSLNDIIENHSNGILIPPFDTCRMADALSCLANDSNLLSSMGDNARHSILKYNLDTISNQWIIKMRQLSASCMS